VSGQSHDPAPATDAAGRLMWEPWGSSTEPLH